MQLKTFSHWALRTHPLYPNTHPISYHTHSEHTHTLRSHPLSYHPHSDHTPSLLQHPLRTHPLSYHPQSEHTHTLRSHIPPLSEDTLSLNTPILSEHTHSISVTFITTCLVSPINKLSYFITQIIPTVIRQHITKRREIRVIGWQSGQSVNSQQPVPAPKPGITSSYVLEER